MIQVQVNRNIISVQETEPLTSGATYLFRCKFLFDASWDGFFRSAVFRAGSQVKTVPLDGEDSCYLPWELLVSQNIGLTVEVSVYGAKDDIDILPTTWDKLGRVRRGSEPGGDVRDPTPNVYDQLTSLIQVYTDKATNDRRVTEEAAETAAGAAQEAREAVASIGTSVSDAAGYAAQADQSAQTAGESATRAAQSAEAAQESASAAQTSAVSAQGSAESAAASGTGAAAAAGQAVTAMEAAQASREAAAASEQNASGASASAVEFANAAAANAASAYSSAEAAAGSAAAAQAAQESASTAADEAKHWSEVAETAAGGGVSSFNGRTGAVTPQAGDYTAADVGAVPTARTVNGKALSADISLTAADVGAAASSHGTHVSFSATAPVAPGTASAGSAATVARSDHKHPLQTTVSGNAGTATKLATARTIRTNLVSTSTASFDGSANVAPGVTGTLPAANGGTGQTTLYPAVGTKGIRASYAGTGEMTPGSTELTTGCLYLQYE